MVFLPLGEALRVRGQSDVARRVAVRGLERHPYDADAHDLLARVLLDQGETEKAIDEWEAALKCVPGHIGALKGMGFVCYQQGRLMDAEQYLSQAAAADVDDERIASGLARVRAELESKQRPAPAPAPAPAVKATNGSTPHVEKGNDDPRYLFTDLVSSGDQAALFLDREGLVLAGTYVVAGGVDVSQEIGAALTGISDEARRAMRHLGLGDWSTIVFESEAARVAMAPAPEDGIVLVAAAPTMPHGLVRRALDRVAERAREWVESLS
ncbi:MAG TPA: tetratricopeptide repeat protein [Gemmatimonadaceae bacterium]|jgi:tetratricopeptide (TPR) repeat protein|nr:tetratricopeptide repeat protein [Gemmatimonadaceae bacterium]